MDSARLRSLQRAAIAAAALVAPSKRPTRVIVAGKRGTILEIALPAELPAEVPDDDDFDEDEGIEPKSAAAEKIIQAMRTMQRPMKAASIAQRAGLSATGAHFKTAFRELKQTQQIYRPDATEAFYWLVNRPLPGS